MRRSAPVHVCCALLVAALLISCSSGEQTGPAGRETLSSAQIRALASQEQEDGHGEQYAVLEDGVVTFEEYDASFTLLEGCLTERGFTVAGPVVSPVDGLRYEFSSDFGSRDTTGALADLDECEARWWTSVAQAYELSQAPVMDPALAEATAECLRGRGLHVAGEEAEVADFVESVGEAAGAEVLQCVQDEGAALYPELPALSVGY